MKKLVLVAAAIPLLFSCVVQQQEPEIPGDCQLAQSDSYNILAKELAAVVNAAVRDSRDFRELIHTEVHKMFDGDYDVLLKDISSMSVTVSGENGTRGGNNITVAELLNNYSDLPESATRGAGSSLIEMLEEMYPGMQISVQG